MRAMGVDFGSKRIGLAVGDAEHGIASPCGLLTSSGTLLKDAEAIGAVGRREQADLLVVGLPLELDGTHSPMSRVCGQLAAKLQAIGWDVRTVDESFSSIEAEEGLVYDRASQRRKRRDGAAACVILERFFRGQA